MPTRQPIVCVLGHVDTGKTLLLDKIRKSSVQAREVGGITQHIGASFFPVKTLKNIAGSFLQRFGGEISIPGLLVIDTPGHEAFANLRRRGGSVADIAILLVDILRGFEAQTHESLKILKARKTPFLVAANKIDRIAGWKSQLTNSFIESYKKQDRQIQIDLDEYLYNVIGKFSQLGFSADRFDNVRDFTRTVAIVPTSAKTGEGITEVVAVLVGLTQQFLKNRLKTTEGSAKGTILEVKEEVGLGMTVNAVIYDGVIRKNDVIVVGGKNQPIKTSVRALLLPKPLDEIRDPRDRFSSVEEVSAAAGVKIVAPNLDDALAGASLYVTKSEKELIMYRDRISEEIQSIRVSTNVDGIILKADALGSLEAIAAGLKMNGVPIRLADVGDVSKRDIKEALVVKGNETLYGVVLAFNVRVLKDAEEEATNRNIPIFRGMIIYHLMDEFLRWMRREKENRDRSEFEQLIKPAKIRILPRCIFRKAKPAIVGVEVLAGRINPKLRLMTSKGNQVGDILQIQDKGKAVSSAATGNQVAVSISGAVVGRHIDEGDILYVILPEHHAKALATKFSERLDPNESESLEELVEIMRKVTPFWST